MSNSNKTTQNNIGSFWTIKSSSANPNTLCQDGLSDVSCFFWNNRHNASKMKRTGSVDSLLSQVNGGSGGDATGTTGPGGDGSMMMIDSPPSGGGGYFVEQPQSYYHHGGGISCSSSSYNQKHHRMLSSKYSNASTRSYKQPVVVGTGRSSGPQYLGSMLNSVGFVDMAGGYSGISSSQHSFYGKTTTTKIPGKRQMSIDINPSNIKINGMKKSDRKKLNKYNFDQQGE